MIPKYKFWESDYPNLESEAEGISIPDFYGTKDNITPICIDTTILKYKVAYREINAISSVAGDGRQLTEDEDFILDLPNAEFTVYGMPYLEASTTYYLVVEGNWSIDGVKYIEIGGDSSGSYASGQKYSIDGGGVWTGSSGVDLCFKIYGKTSLESDVELQASYGYGNYNTNYALRDAGGNTKLAQGFDSGSNAYYVTKIILYFKRVGSPGGNVRVQIHSDQSGTIVGGKTNSVATSGIATSMGSRTNNFSQLSTESEILISAAGYEKSGGVLIETASDMLKDIIINGLGKSESILKVATSGEFDSFDELASAHPEEVCAYFNRELSFNTVLGKLEAGALFKMIPGLSTKLIVPYYVSGEPSGTPHLRDEEIISMKSVRDVGSVRYQVQIKFDENPTLQKHKVRQQTSDVAQYLYGRKNVLTIETFLKNAADASSLAGNYLEMFEYPQRKITIKTSGYGLDLVPTRKIKVTKARADNTNGVFEGKLFRILGIKKQVSKGGSEIGAIDDEQTLVT